nr:MAG TPA: hypothetical protein [Caudoviricetes sp.]
MTFTPKYLLTAINTKRISKMPKKKHRLSAKR